MAHLVKNLTAAAGVAVKAQVRSVAWCSGLEDLALLLRRLVFNPWPRNFPMLWVWPKKKEKMFKTVKQSD